MMQMSRNAFLPVCSRRSSSFSSELAGRSHGRGGRSRSGGMFGGTTKALSPVDPAPITRPFASLLGVCVCVCVRVCVWVCVQMLSLSSSSRVNALGHVIARCGCGARLRHLATRPGITAITAAPLRFGLYIIVI